MDVVITGLRERVLGGCTLGSNLTSPAISPFRRRIVTAPSFECRTLRAAPRGVRPTKTKGENNRGERDHGLMAVVLLALRRVLEER